MAKETIEGFHGTIKILGPGGVFLPLTTVNADGEVLDIEQRVVNSISGREVSKVKSQEKEDAKPKKKRKRAPRMRVFRECDYTKGAGR